MKAFLADESVDGPVIAALRARGYDMLVVIEFAPSSPDHAVLAMAVDRRLPLLTFDSDFGELIFLHGSTTPPGVVYLRTKGLSPTEVVERAMSTITQLDPVGVFVTIDRNEIRTRPLPLRQTGAPSDG